MRELPTEKIVGRAGHNLALVTLLTIAIFLGYRSYVHFNICSFEDFVSVNSTVLYIILAIMFLTTSFSILRGGWGDSKRWLFVVAFLLVAAGMIAVLAYIFGVQGIRCVQ